MVSLNEVRRNELAVEPPASFDAGLVFVGIIRTPWRSRLECPRQGRRELVRQSPASHGGDARDVFAAVAGNPIGTALASLVARDGPTLFVKGLDCLDGTPLIGLKPDHCQFTPLAPPQPADFETG